MLKKYKKDLVRSYFDHDPELGELIFVNGVPGCIVEQDEIWSKILWSDNLKGRDLDDFEKMLTHVMSRQIAEEIDAEIIRDLEAMSKSK